MALRLGPTAPSATVMHDFIRPRISMCAGGIGTPRPADASITTVAISSSRHTAVRSWDRSPTRQARRIKLFQHGNGGLRVIYFESPEYTKRRVANPHREGVPTPPSTRDSRHTYIGQLYLFRVHAQIQNRRWADLRHMETHRWRQDGSPCHRTQATRVCWLRQIRAG